MEAEVAQRFDKLEKMVLTLISQKAKGKAWVRASEIMQVTGWDKQQMQKARRDGLVDYRDGSNGRQYDLNSIHPLLIK